MHHATEEDQQKGWIHVCAYWLMCHHTIPDPVGCSSHMRRSFSKFPSGQRWVPQSRPAARPRSDEVLESTLRELS